MVMTPTLIAERERPLWAPAGAAWPRTANRERSRAVYSACGRLREVLLHRPGPEFGAVKEPGPALWRDLPDPARARDEHDQLAEIYRDHDVLVNYIPDPPRDRPNLVFCCDLWAMCGNRAIIACPASPVRAGEERAARRAIASLGIPLANTFDEEATFEGGDLLVVNEDLVLIGHGTRTNLRGAMEIRRLFRAAGFSEVLVVPVPDGYLHLDTLINFADKDLALLACDRPPDSLARALARHGFRVLHIPSGYEAETGMAVNLVALEPGVVVLAAGNPNTRNQLNRAGVYCIEVDIRELAKASGGLHCITGVLNREAA